MTNHPNRNRRVTVARKITELAQQGKLTPWECWYLGKLIHEDMDSEDKAIDRKDVLDQLDK